MRRNDAVQYMYAPLWGDSNLNQPAPTPTESRLNRQGRRRRAALARRARNAQRAQG